MARKPLNKWIDEALVDPMKDRITAIALIHMQGAAQKEIYTYKISPGNAVDAKVLSDLFQDKARAYAQDLVGPQTFQLFAFYGTTEPQARQPFVITPETDQTSGLSTEAATSEGWMQQTMRHKEAGMSQIFNQQMALNHHSVNMINSMSNHIQKLQSDNMEAFTVVKDLLIRLSDNDHNRKMQQMEYERTSKEREKWLSFAPPLVNRLLGQEVFPQDLEDTALIETIADNLTEEHLTMLQVLPEAIRGPLAARIDKHMQKKAAQVAAARALPKYNGSAEDDVTGGTH